LTFISSNLAGVGANRQGLAEGGEASILKKKFEEFNVAAKSMLASFPRIVTDDDATKQSRRWAYCESDYWQSKQKLLSIVDFMKWVDVYDGIEV